MRAAGLMRGLAKRVIACLDVRSNDQGDLVVTKGDQYNVREASGDRDVRNLGLPVQVHPGACLLSLSPPESRGSVSRLCWQPLCSVPPGCPGRAMLPAAESVLLTLRVLQSLNSVLLTLQVLQGLNSTLKI